VTGKRWPFEKGLFGGAWAWPEVGQVALVLDGIAIDNLPVKVYQWAQDQLEADWLYIGTPWEQVRSKSPWLVYLDHSNDPVLNHFLEEQAVCETGYLLVGADGQDRLSLAAAMRHLLQVERIEGIPELLRIGHPDIALGVIGQHLLQGFGGSGWPFSALIAPDGVEEQWVYYERQSAGLITQSAGKPALVVDDELLKGFRRFNRRQAIIAHLGVAGEGDLAWLGSGTRSDHVQRLTVAFDQAFQLGFNTPRSQALFLEVLQRSATRPWLGDSLPAALLAHLNGQGAVIERLENALQAAQSSVSLPSAVQG
jgi:hypothetical protein